MRAQLIACHSGKGKPPTPESLNPFRVAASKKRRHAEAMFEMRATLPKVVQKVSPEQLAEMRGGTHGRSG